MPNTDQKQTGETIKREAFEGVERHEDGSVSIVGRAAVDMFRGKVLASAIGLWLKTGMLPTRGVGVRDMARMATEYTGKQYAGSKKGLAQAKADLDQVVYSVRTH